MVMLGDKKGKTYEIVWLKTHFSLYSGIFYMALAQNKRGFYVYSPVMGAVIFLIAAGMAYVISQEHQVQADLASASDFNGRLIFVSEAILADSFDNLLQHKLERFTIDFLDHDYLDIIPDRDWKSNLRDDLVDYYKYGLGDTLGLQLETYVEAYGKIAGMDGCSVNITSEEFYESSNVYESDEGDGTIKARTLSLGRQIRCKSKDPPGETVVDILGRYYRINVRVASLFGVGRFAVQKAKEAMNHGIEYMNNQDPIATWESGRWMKVDLLSNKVTEGDIAMTGLIDSWVNIMEQWFSKGIMGVTNSEAEAQGFLGIKMESFEIEAEDGEYDIDDFEVSCVADEEFRNCMPNLVVITIGEEECSSGIEPKGGNPYYRMTSKVVTDGKGYIPEVDAIWKRVFSPLQNVCIEYAGLDRVWEVCKRWEAKPKSVVFKGEVNDDNVEYMPTESEDISFKFKNLHSNVYTDEIEDQRIQCGEGGRDYGIAEENMDNLLRNLFIMVGSSEGPGLSLWIDKGSKISSIDGGGLKDVYKDMVEVGYLPKVWFRGGVEKAKDFDESKYGSKPLIQPKIIWEPVWRRCKDPKTLDELCSALGAGTHLEDTFCDDLFNPRGGSGGSRGTLRCTGRTFPWEIKELVLER